MGTHGEPYASSKCLSSQEEVRYIPNTRQSDKSLMRESLSNLVLLTVAPATLHILLKNPSFWKEWLKLIFNNVPDHFSLILMV